MEARVVLWKGWVVKRRGTDGYVEKDGWLCGEGWMAKRRGMDDYVEKEGRLCGEEWVAKQRGMGG
jgi:hypothetical protein